MTNEQLVAQIKAGEDVQKNMEQLYLQEGTTFILWP